MPVVDSFAQNPTLARFRCDVTPPVGHPLCAAWYGLAKSITDPLWANGIVLKDIDQPPVVLCALDWCELSNDSHLQWRNRLAEAAGTDPDRVTVHCTHAHCSPWPDAHAQALIEQHPGAPKIMDVAWCDSALERVAEAVAVSLTQASPVTHLGIGQATVDSVASNRRVMGGDGKVKAVRLTATRDPEVRAEPVGLIDPILRTVSFWHDQRELAALHYYAVHPSSHDRDQAVTPDFAGLARERFQAEHPDTHQIYFTGCAGNITAGKYNDGSVENRPVLTDRIYRALHASSRSADRFAWSSSRWDIVPVQLPPREDMQQASLERTLADPKANATNRSRAALMLAYLARADRPIPLTCLTLGERVKLLHLPSESFIEYQLEAQLIARGRTVMTAAYGDCGPGYICLKRSFDEGGYEPTDSFVAGRSESIMRSAIRSLITDEPLHQSS